MDEVARVDVVESAFGSTRGTIYAGVQGAASSNSSDTAQAGVIIGGSPLNRLTLHGLFGRDAQDRFSPVVTAHVLVFGDRSSGYGLGLLGQYKAEGFTEAGGEAELGLTFGLKSGRYHLDANLIGGLGVEEEEVGEVDAEGKLRFGYDAWGVARFGAMAQVRARLAGDRALSGGRNWDALGGPEVQSWVGPLLFGVAGGATTVAVADGAGGFIMVTLAAVASL